MTIKELLADEATKDQIAKALNDAIDLPFFSEKAEGKMAETAVDVVFDALLKIIG